jgi:hypothetical protein
MDVSPEEAQRFREALDSIDDLVDEINADGPVVVEEPADMGRVLLLLGRKFNEVADLAPDHLEAGVRSAATTFLDAAQALFDTGPPEMSVDKANRIYDEAMGGIEEAGAAVREFKEEHCGKQ